MEEFMFQSGKMPVVIGVLLLILFGIFAYLIHMERKLKRLEREMKSDRKRSSPGNHS